MKKNLIFMILCLCFFMFSQGNIASANSGMATIPYFYASDGTYYSSSVYFISNVTEEPITVTITLYKEDGTILTDTDNDSTTGTIRGTNFSSYSEYSDINSPSSLTVTLNGLESGYLSICSSTLSFGHGVIKWNQDSNALYGLVSHGYMYQKRNSTDQTSRTAIDINNSQPF